MARCANVKRKWPYVVGGIVCALLLFAGFIRLRYGGGKPFPSRISDPELDGNVLELVAELPLPPGNIAVSPEGRVFFTFHPDGKPKTKLAEWVDGEAVPFPSEAAQAELQTPLGLRLDAQGRLWLVDNAEHGTGQPQLVAFDVASGDKVVEHHFESDIVGLGSHLNDLAVHPDGKHLYIAEASIFAKSPALIVYDIEHERARRLLEGHASVMPEEYYISVDGEPIEVFGLFAVRPGVDSIALDRRGEWLYFAAVTATRMYRVRARDLDNLYLSADELAARVEVFGDKTLSDGITTDDAGGIYLTDPQHDAVVRMNADASLTTLVRDDRLRWPDGFSFGPDGYLYVTCSALQHVIMKSADHVAAHAPYHIFRFKPGASATPGH